MWTVVPEVILCRGHNWSGPLGCRVGLNAGQVQESCVQDNDLLFARAGGGVASSRVQGQDIKRPEASYQRPVGLTVQLAGREINADHCVLGPHLATAAVWISQSFTLLGLRRLCADSNFLRVSRRLVP